MSARSRSAGAPGRINAEFLLADRGRAKDLTLLFSSRYAMMACVERDGKSSYPERWAGVKGLFNAQEVTLV